MAISTYAKLQAESWSLGDENAPTLNPVQGNTDDIADTFTVDNIGGKPATVRINDNARRLENTLGMYLEGFEEVV